MKGKYIAYIFLSAFLLWESGCVQQDKILFSNPPREKLLGQEIKKALEIYGQPSFAFEASEDCFSSLDDWTFQQIVLTKNPSLKHLKLYIWVHQLSYTPRQEERLYIIVDKGTDKIVDVVQDFPVGGVWKWRLTK
jgi:hypothetical protein